MKEEGAAGAVSEKSEKWNSKQQQAQAWFALPKALREPQKQEDLAALLRVSDKTIWRWKQKPGWQAAVNRIARVALVEEVPEVFASLAREAKAGSYQHQKLFLEAVGELERQPDVGVTFVLSWGDEE